MASQQSNPIIIVQGAQWGSEAKGAVAAALGIQRNIDYAVRTGTVNAGHTVIFNARPYKMQQLPVGWVNPETELVVGPGAYIHPVILLNEIRELARAIPHLNPYQRILIDHRCGLHLPAHTKRSSASGRHYKMGATGKGCSEAVIDKINGRGNDYPLFYDWLQDELRKPGGTYEELRNLKFFDTSQVLNCQWDQGSSILIEGTQGTMLDLHLGPYPYTTHKQTQCGSWMAEAGLSPSLPTEICLVARTYPIRVAGNSGPMPQEMSWVDLTRDLNARLAKFGKQPRISDADLRTWERACEAVAKDMGQTDFRIERWNQQRREENLEFVSELHARALEKIPHVVVMNLMNLFELTTVTKKLRRIAALDVHTLKESVTLNRPAYLAMTFINYLYPETWGLDIKHFPDETNLGIRSWLLHLENAVGAPTRYISTGPETRLVQEIVA